MRIFYQCVKFLYSLKQIPDTYKPINKFTLTNHLAEHCFIIVKLDSAISESQSCWRQHTKDGISMVNVGYNNVTSRKLLRQSHQKESHEEFNNEPTYQQKGSNFRILRRPIYLLNVFGIRYVQTGTFMKINRVFG